MSTVFVWYPKNGNVGHASMQLDAGGYVSWWPSKNINLKNHSTKDAASPGISEDKKSEGGIPNYASPPIKGLDEAAMLKHWCKLSGRLPKEGHKIAQEMKFIPGGSYDLFTKSCAGVVLDVLIAGGMFSKYPLTASMASNNLVVSPLLIKDLSEAMAGDLSNKIVSVLTNADAGATSVRRLLQYF